MFSASENALELVPAGLLYNSLTGQCTSKQLKDVGLSKDIEFFFSPVFFEVTNIIIYYLFILPVCVENY